MIEQSLKANKPSNTEVLVERLLINSKEDKWLPIAKRALLNYLTVLLKGSDQEAVKKVFTFMGVSQVSLPLFSENTKLTAERAALLNGFTAHYLDLDDTQSNLKGHPSAVIMSALFAITDSKDDTYNFLWSYVQGVEIAGKIGRILNPKLALQGWHTTGVIGTIAAAAAIGVYKNYNKEKMINLLSFAATQSSGIEIQSGSDGKPFNAGIAARNAVTAFLFTESGLLANQDPFNNERGWFKVIQNIDISISDLTANWLNPAEVERPGLWFKTYPFCSAGMSSFDAAKQLYELGIRIKGCKNIIIHFPLNGDHALRHHNPKNGKEGKFSAEYIVWQVLTFGDVKEKLFDASMTPKQFIQDSILFTRKKDLENSDIDARPTMVEVVLNDGSSISRKVIYPKGSPRNKVDTEMLELNLIKMLENKSVINEKLQAFLEILQIKGRQDE